MGTGGGGRAALLLDSAVCCLCSSQAGRAVCCLFLNLAERHGGRRVTWLALGGMAWMALLLGSAVCCLCLNQVQRDVFFPSDRACAGRYHMACAWPKRRGCAMRYMPKGERRELRYAAWLGLGYMATPSGLASLYAQPYELFAASGVVVYFAVPRGFYFASLIFPSLLK